MSKRTSKQSHDFTQVVKEIPTLIVEEVKRKELLSHTREENIHEKKHAALVQKKQTGYIYTSPKNSRRWMLTGVVLCTACIFGFWILYISDLINKNKATINPTSSFTSGDGSDVSTLINTFSKLEGDLKKKLKSPSELKAMVVTALLPMLSSSSTPTSTEKLSTTSTTTE